MSMSAPELTDEQRQALDDNHGFVRGPAYVLMRIDVFRNTMGVGTDEELAESLKAIEEGLADIDSGRTRPFRDVLSELEHNS